MFSPHLAAHSFFTHHRSVLPRPDTCTRIANTIPCTKPENYFHQQTRHRIATQTPCRRSASEWNAPCSLKSTNGLGTMHELRTLSTLAFDPKSTTLELGGMHFFSSASTMDVAPNCLCSGWSNELVSRETRCPSSHGHSRSLVDESRAVRRGICAKSEKWWRRCQCPIGGRYHSRSRF